ncbi:MAG TPA: hypothetical protein VL117_05640 [Thermoleophilia bacterium]|nr:hypothetical protein [Thermoleophilia bacterium]
MSDRNDSQRAAFDDDRLLDFALGLEDDPELAAALSHSARLRERLADLKSDLAAIDAELRRSIPPVGESYTQPDASRWSRLWPFFGRGEAARRRPLRGRRLAAVLVAAALAVAIVVGLVTVLPHSSSSNSAAGRAAKSAGMAAPHAAAGAQTVPAPTTGANGVTAGASGAGAVADKAAAYRDVAVVRVGPVRGAGQSYSVVRTLKGSVPATFSLVLRSIQSAPQAGSLAVAYLDPVKASAGVSLAPAPPEFAFAGQPALVVALPAGVAATDVRLPH